MDTLDHVLDYAPAFTLREVVGSALANAGKGWDDVRGVALLLSDYVLPDELFDGQTGLVHPEMIDEALDFDIRTGSETDWPWGGFQDDLYHRFEMTIWLEDCLLKFEDRYMAGSYIDCRLVPTTPPSAHSYSLPLKDSANP